MDSTVQIFLISLAIVGAIFVALYFAYEQGYLDPIIEQIGIYMFKAKAAAEKKKMQAQGMKAGEDFLDSQLKGNQQAAQVAQGVGSFGSLKKQI